MTGAHAPPPPEYLVALPAALRYPHCSALAAATWRERQAAYTISYKHLLLAILDENPYLGAGSKQALAATAGLAVQNSSRITVLMVDAHEPSGDPAVRLDTIQWCAPRFRARLCALCTEAAARGALTRHAAAGTSARAAWQAPRRSWRRRWTRRRRTTRLWRSVRAPARPRRAAPRACPGATLD